MPRFSERSLKRLESCEQPLPNLFLVVIRGFDCTVIEGHRGEHKQNEYYRTGKSKLQFPHSKHNIWPSWAVDVAPCPINWNDRERFYFFAGYVLGIASELNIGIRWGGDWDSDTEVHDQTFFDLLHFELRPEA